MLSTARLIAFVPSRDLEPAKVFYVEVLGLELVSQDPLALVLTANGALVRIAKVGEFQPATFTILGFEVASIKRQSLSPAAKGSSLRALLRHAAG